VNSKIPNHRKTNRLTGYDYRTPGGYFITICTVHKKPLFGEIENGEILPNQIGKIVQNQWFQIPNHRPAVILYEDEFILMPDHIHGIVWIDDPEPEKMIVCPKRSGLQANSLGAILGLFKSRTSRLVNELRNTPGDTIWQRNYYDYIIRNDKDLTQIRKYILDNPLKYAQEKRMESQN